MWYRDIYQGYKFTRHYLKRIFIGKDKAGVTPPGSLQLAHRDQYDLFQSLPGTHQDFRVFDFLSFRLTLPYCCNFLRRVLEKHGGLTSS